MNEQQAFYLQKFHVSEKRDKFTHVSRRLTDVGVSRKRASQFIQLLSAAFMLSNRPSSVPF